MATIHETIEYYKNNIDKYWEGEKYKWIALQHFQDNWDLNADNFPEMWEESYSKAGNLLNGAMYYPYKMMCKFAKLHPDKVKGLFSTLYDENIPLSERIKTFHDGCDEMLKEFSVNRPKAKSHYQDLRALCVYLSFMYPDKYYLYKSRMYKEYAKSIGYEENSTHDDPDVRKYENFSSLCQLIIDEASKDSELVSMQKDRENASVDFYKDGNLHLLAQTIIYVWNQKYGETSVSTSETKSVYLPSIDEYSLGITKDDWKRFISEIENPIHKGCMRVLKCFVDIGGEASSEKLSEAYKGNPSIYTDSVTNTSRRALDYFGKEPWSDEDGECLFAIAFQWKYGSDNDPGKIIYRMRDELSEAIKELNLDDIELEYKKDEKSMNSSGIGLNTILYGPPGTGKTYHVAYYAVAICDNIPIEEVLTWNVDDVRARYEVLKDQGRISFTTFHQSYGYEEFIEGIRPVMESDSTVDPEAVTKELTYKIESGVFKRFCDKARNSYVSETNSDWGLNDNPTVWKVSLEGTGDNKTRTDCMENGCIRIGWSEYGPDITRESSYEHGGRVVLNAFYNKMKKGDIVISCYSSEITDAIGVITGDPEWDDSYPVYKRVRTVKWLVKDIRENIIKLNDNKPMVLASVYKLDVSSEDALEIVKKYLDSPKKFADKKNYVFIIDEINRGNISKVFGELITLIETTKREGAKEETRVKLPYSGQMFGVPDNVYILGTMNTADRSIALMDTALRRRFQFVEMMPDLDVIDGLTITEGDVSLDVAEMLGIINKRIEFLYDREHTIGHAFFASLLDVEMPTVSDLAMIFKKSIIPLLQEYFYEDYDKIRLVLGDNAKKDKNIEFIVAESPEKDLFRGNVTDEDYKDYVFLVNEKAFSDIRSYKGISDKL